MKMHVINFTQRALQQVGKCLYGAKIIVIDLAKNINDPSKSPAFKSIEDLERGVYTWGLGKVGVFFVP